MSQLDRRDVICLSEKWEKEVELTLVTADVVSRSVIVDIRKLIEF
jgi:hypothetical protein